MGCDVCKGSVGNVRGARRCARCRFKMRHAARRVREFLHALADDSVLALLDELADRPQPATSEVFARLRGAVAVVHMVEPVALLGADGWLLDAESAA